MAKHSFIKRFLSLGRGGSSTETETAEGGEALEASASGEAAVKPSITEILFRRSGAPPATSEERETEGETTRPGLPEKPTEKKLSRKEETAQKISEGIDNLSGMLKSINSQLETGNDRGRILADAVQELPEVLRSIPETSNAQLEFLGTISKQLDLQSTRTAEVLDCFSGLPEVLKSIPASQERQARQLEHISEELAASATQQMKLMKAAQREQSAAVNTIQAGQKESLNLFHKAQQQTLASYQSAQGEQTARMEEFMERTQRSMNRALLIGAIVVSAALLGTGALIFFGS